MTDREAYEEVMVVNDWDEDDGCYVVKAFDRQGNRLIWGEILPLYRKVSES